MPARCPECRGMGFRIVAGAGTACVRCEGLGMVPASQDVPPAVVELLHERSKGICEVCHVAVASDKHHRLFRSRGGLHLIENLLHVCGPGNVFGCHGDAHGPTPQQGTALSRYEKRHAHEIPFRDRRGALWLLDREGGKTEVRTETTRKGPWDR